MRRSNLPQLLFAAALCHRALHAVQVLPRHCGGAIRHVHLSVGRDPSTSMIVSFASIPSMFTAPVGGVLIGTSPDGELMTTVYLEDEPAMSYNLTVPEGHRRSNAGNYGDQYVSPHYHHVTVTGLEPNTTYYYLPKVHHSAKGFSKYKNLRGPTDESLLEQELEEGLEDERDAEGEESEDRELRMYPPYDGSKHECPSPDRIRSFTTAPAVGSDAANFAVIGDLGQFPHSEETLMRLQRDREDTNAILLVGDIAYTQDDHRRWDTFFDFLDDYPIVDRIPMQICPGNHDINKLPDRNEIFLAYEKRFRMPRVHPPQLGVYQGPTGKMNMDHPPYPLPYEWGNSYYSFKYGPAHVIMINAYASMEPDSIQYNWIASELDAVNRTLTPWLLAVLHTPIYNTFSIHKKDYQVLAAKKHLEPLFVEHSVNMVFTGHIHAYLRTTAVAFDQPSAKGPVHITVGAGGRKCEAPFADAQPEAWTVVRDATWYGYGMFRILNRTTAVWDWIHTSQTDDGRTYNQVGHSNITLPSGPSRDHVVFQNQLYL